MAEYRVSKTETDYRLPDTFNMFMKEQGVVFGGQKGGWQTNHTQAASVNGNTFSLTVHKAHETSVFVLPHDPSRKTNNWGWTTNSEGWGNGTGDVEVEELIRIFQDAVDNQVTTRITMHINDMDADGPKMPKSAGKMHTSVVNTNRYHDDETGELSFNDRQWDFAEGLAPSYQHTLECRVKIDATTGERNETGEKRAKSFIRFLNNWLNENYYDNTPTTPTTPTEVKPTIPGNKMTDQEAREAAALAKASGASKSGALKELRSNGAKISVARWNNAWNC